MEFSDDHLMTSIFSFPPFVIAGFVQWHSITQIATAPVRGDQPNLTDKSRDDSTVFFAALDRVDDANNDSNNKIKLLNQLGRH